MVKPEDDCPQAVARVHSWKELIWEFWKPVLQGIVMAAAGALISWASKRYGPG